MKEQLAAVQMQDSVHRLSERNCVEIVLKLIETKQVEVRCVLLVCLSVCLFVCFAHRIDTNSMPVDLWQKWQRVYHSKAIVQ